MMEPRSKFVELVEQIFEKTKADDIEWKETSDENRFTTLLRSGGIQIERIQYEDEDGFPMPYFEVTLLNSKSQPIQSFQSNSILPIDVQPGLLGNLFELAQFNARKGAGVLDALLTEVHAIASH